MVAVVGIFARGADIATQDGFIDTAQSEICPLFQRGFSPGKSSINGYAVFQAEVVIPGYVFQIV